MDLGIGGIERVQEPAAVALELGFCDPLVVLLSVAFPLDEVLHLGLPALAVLAPGLGNGFEPLLEDLLDHVLLVPLDEDGHGVDGRARAVAVLLQEGSVEDGMNPEGRWEIKFECHRSDPFQDGEGSGVPGHELVTALVVELDVLGG